MQDKVGKIHSFLLPFFFFFINSAGVGADCIRAAESAWRFIVFINFNDMANGCWRSGVCEVTRSDWWVSDFR